VILVAGIGNIFLGDDAFGVEVVKRMRDMPIPEGVDVVDFGIRGFDLAYALMDEKYESAILVDAMPRGGPPGSVYTIQPDLNDFHGVTEPVIDTHGMNPMKVFELVNALGGASKPVFIVGCEPEWFGNEEEGSMELSESVRAAIPHALNALQTLLFQMKEGTIV
jgi:hydrogenase maturation protease